MFKKLVAVVASLMMLMPTAVFAEEGVATIPVSIEGTESAKVTISSDSKEAMAAIDGETTIEVKDSASFKINYNEPVSYTYKLTQVAGSENDVTYDTNEYTVHVFIEAETDGKLTPHVVVWKTESADKSDGVHFTNVKKTTPESTAKPSSVPQTGDSTNLMAYGVGAGLSIGLFILLITLRRRAKEE